MANVGSYFAVSIGQDPVERTAGVRGMDRLLELQDLDLATDRLRARLRLLESEEDVRLAHEAVREAEARLGELRLALDAVVGEQRRLEVDVDSLERKIEAERKRLYDGSVANPKELQSIDAEVRGLTARKSRVEDLILEQMERREQMEARVGPLESEAAEARRRLAEVEEGSAKELGEIDRELAELASRREALVREVDPELLELYEDLRRLKKGLGAAALTDGVCQGCHQKLSPMYLEGLKRSDGIRRCEYCRRILVFD
jgi:predicted  nucleic acid-binding Zn-ribbon protein